MESNTFSATTPLYYVNDRPHMGSAYTTIAVDVICRHYRQRGMNVLMITGTDEHGQKIQQTAANRGLSPQKHCDEISAEFPRLWQQLNIKNDRFIRTTSHNHEILVKEFFGRVFEGNNIYLGHQSGWYCIACEEFKEEREILEKNICPIHNRSCEWRNEQNYFFRLSAYQEKLQKFYQDNPEFIQPEYRRTEIYNFITEGLKDFSISRTNLDWGIPLPIDPSHTLYVWFDALLGYITALLEPGSQVDLESAISNYYPFNLQVVGKDILKFHAIYWPAMLMAANIPLPKQVFAHGFLTKDGRKMGKSLGNTLDPYELTETYGADAVRYYFLKQIEFGRDGDFTEKSFIDTINADLANNLGNLLNRTVFMVHKYFNGRIPSIEPSSISQENIAKLVGESPGEYITTMYERMAFSEICRKCLSFVDNCNRYIDEQSPWHKFKSGQVYEVGELLYSVLESIRLTAYLLYPIVPEITRKIYIQIGYSSTHVDSYEDFFSWKESAWGILASEQYVPEPKPI